MSRDSETTSGARSAEPGDSGQGTAGSAAAGRPDPAPYRPKYTPLWNNLITMAGLFLVITAILGLLTFALFHLVAPVTNPYVDIVGFLVVPGILVLGVVIIPFGILLKSWRLHRRNPAEHLAFRFPRIDLNDPGQRRAAKVVVGGTFALLPVVGLSSYHGYHYTDSVSFCSKACHAVMEPQATTYMYSDHARVPCAECHIGEGAGWFVKSKLSGTRQVLAMWQDSFSRPIPPAITHLRPARETCEHCHWPEKFFGAQLAEIVRFSSDEANTRHEISMLLKTGGGDEATGRATGIHRHMALEGRVEYVATDDTLQQIPWVKFTAEDGTDLIYRSDGRPSSDPKPEGQVRVLDCMDCHNRPAHVFRAPDEAVDNYLDIGPDKIDPALPFIKRQAVDVLDRPYPDVPTAKSQIGILISEFYRANYPELWNTRQVDIYHAIDSIRKLYRNSFFPSMNVDWRTYPDNIGHRISPGCFRCHEGRHVDQYGERISHDCSICHTFFRPVEREGKSAVIQQGEFIHPAPLEGLHARLRCSQCHDGGRGKPPTCAGCHEQTTALRTADGPPFARFAIEPDPMNDLDCDACHDISEPTSTEAINATCTDCHDPEGDERFDGLLASWDKTAGKELAAAAAALANVKKLTDELADGPDRRRVRQWLDQNALVLELLREAGPLHNFEASIQICKQITGEAKELTAGSGQAKR